MSQRFTGEAAPTARAGSASVAPRPSTAARSRGGAVAALLIAAAGATGCGYSEAAMQAQRARVRSLEGVVAQEREARAASEREARETESRRRALADVLHEVGGNLDAMRTERREMATSLSALEGERDTLRDSLGDARRALEAVRAREAQAQARAQLFRTMLERFRTMIDAGQLRVRVARNRMVVELPEAVLFDTGRAALKADGQRVLTEVAEVLRAMTRDFQVAGHTDNVPIHNARFASNWELSTARAITVSRFLMGHGLAPERVSAAGYADTQPAAGNDTPEGRQLNRRIEIVLLPALDELPDLSPLREMSAAP